MTSSNVSFCPQPKDVQITVREKERNQTTLTDDKLESEEFHFSVFKRFLSDSWIIKSTEQLIVAAPLKLLHHAFCLLWHTCVHTKSISGCKTITMDAAVCVSLVLRPPALHAVDVSLLCYS